MTSVIQTRSLLLDWLEVGPDGDLEAVKKRHRFTLLPILRAVGQRPQDYVDSERDVIADYEFNVLNTVARNLPYLIGDAVTTHAEVQLLLENVAGVPSQITSEACTRLIMDGCNGYRLAVNQEDFSLSVIRDKGA